MTAFRSTGHGKADDAPNGARPITLWDTAGVRKKARVTEKLEKLSVADGLRAVKFAEIVVLLIDATSPFDKQDIQLADLVEREGAGWSLPSINGI